MGKYLGLKIGGLYSGMVRFVRRSDTGSPLYQVGPALKGLVHQIFFFNFGFYFLFLKTGGSHSTDLVSVLLERGNKLRNDMIVSTVDGVTANPTSVGTNAHMNGLISPLRP